MARLGLLLDRELAGAGYVWTSPSQALEGRRNKLEPGGDAGEEEVEKGGLKGVKSLRLLPMCFLHCEGGT